MVSGGPQGASGAVPELHRVAVLIPALNEAEALPVVLDVLPVGEFHTVLVVDNGSTDGTGEVAAGLGATVAVEGERGYGAACLAGLALLRGLDPQPDVVVFMDADHPEDAGQIAQLLEALGGGADLVLGTRVDDRGGTGNLHAHARWGNRLVLSAVRLLWRRGFHDLAPFRAIRFASLETLQMDDRNWGWTLQMQLRALSQGMQITEVQVPHRPRAKGQSKISGSFKTSVRVGLKMFYTIARERLR